MNALAERIATELHAGNPYDGFPFEDYPKDVQGWQSRSAAFEELIERLRPQLVIEVGTWKGASAAFMCEIMVRAGIPGAVVCVDTWLGGERLWQHADDPAFGELRRYMRFGRPVELYNQFLANVMHLGYRDRIVPLPNTSSNAARWLRAAGVTAQLVYLDGSHHERDVYFDIVDYWELLDVGGVIAGDDWSEHYPGVEAAVSRFAREAGCSIHLRDDGKWYVCKEIAEARNSG